MHSDAGSFVDLCLTEMVKATDIDNFVEAWHSGTSNKHVWDFLGLTPEEYARWIEQPESIDAIVEARRSARATGSSP